VFRIARPWHNKSLEAKTPRSALHHCWKIGRSFYVRGGASGVLPQVCVGRNHSESISFQSFLPCRTPDMNAALNQPATHPASNTGKAAIKKRIVPSAFAQQVAGGDVITPSGLSESFAIFTFLGLWLRRWTRLSAHVSQPEP